jgi:hypothetical protein
MGAAGPLSSLQVTPDRGPAGVRIKIAGDGFPPGAEVTFLWFTAEGRYRTEADATGVIFHGYAYDPTKVVLGKAVSDSLGRASISFGAPQDIAGPHKIVAVAGNRELAEGLYHYARTATVTPLKGPVGTPIDITVHGLGPAPWNAAALSYDNHFVGFVSAVTTHGTAHFRIRAAGGPGPHIITLNSATNAVPYLNSQQGPALNVLQIVSHRDWIFTVTPGATPPPTQVEWPAPNRVARIAPDPGSQAAPGVVLRLTPASGLIGSHVKARAEGLGAGDQAQVVWGMMMRQDPVVAHAAQIRDQAAELKRPFFTQTRTLFSSASAPNGTVTGDFTVPDQLGGWHMVQVVRDGATLVSAPYFVKRTLVTTAPSRVKVGQELKIEIRGIGWTELDNGVAVTYDNAYMGYACGFNARGDVVIPLLASGGPGVHLIDLYPMIYQGKGEPPWSYQVPQLTALEDAPGLGLGYALPIIRLAVVVVP